MSTIQRSCAQPEGAAHVVGIAAKLYTQRSWIFLTTTLPNGLLVITAPMPEMYSVTVAVNVTVGSRFEADAEAGSAHLVEHMLFKGTQARPSAEAISETIDRVGGMLNASTDKELTLYWAKVSKFHAPLATDLLADIVRNSLFDDAEFLKEQRVVIEELGMSMDTPQEWVHVVSDEQCWPDTPIGRDVAGSRESVAALTRGGVVDFYRKHYDPSSTIVVVAGGISHKDALAIATDGFGDWAATEIAEDAQPVAASYLEGAPTVYAQKRSTEQVNLCLATMGIPRTHADRYAFELLVSILGGFNVPPLSGDTRTPRACIRYPFLPQYVARYRCTGHLRSSRAGTRTHRRCRNRTAIASVEERAGAAS